MSAHGMSEAGGLREGLVRWLGRWESATDEWAVRPMREQIAALLAAHPAPETDSGCLCAHVPSIPGAPNVTCPRCAPEADPTAGERHDASTSAGEPCGCPPGEPCDIETDRAALVDVDAAATLLCLCHETVCPVHNEAADRIGEYDVPSLIGAIADALAAREAKARAEAGEQIAQAIEAGVQSSHPNEGYKDGFRRAAQIAREVTR